MLQNTNYFWRAYLERPIWETILRTRGSSGVHWGFVWWPFQMSSKFGELIGTALQIWRAHFASSPNWDLKINFLKSVLSPSVNWESIRVISKGHYSLSGVRQTLHLGVHQGLHLGVHQGSVGWATGGLWCFFFPKWPFQMSSKFGELISKALQIWRAHCDSSRNW